MRTNYSTAIENDLLATHISNNPEFEKACASNDPAKILAIVNSEMEKHNLYTAGSKKLKADIIRMISSKRKTSDILAFVWNSRMSGTGFKVI